MLLLSLAHVALAGTTTALVQASQALVGVAVQIAHLAQVAGTVALAQATVLHQAHLAGINYVFC